jgi:hypothetical protein
MKQLYKDRGAAIWWVDGWGHGGYFVAVWGETPLELHEYFNPKVVFQYGSGRTAFVVFIYEEDQDWARLHFDNPWLHYQLVRKSESARGKSKKRVEYLAARLWEAVIRTVDIRKKMATSGRALHR